MEKLRKLHNYATRKDRKAYITSGLIGGLILGTGMSLCMTELGAFLGHWAMLTGIGVVLMGLAMVALAYPVYHIVLKKARQQIAPEILRLSEELLK